MRHGSQDDIPGFIDEEEVDPSLSPTQNAEDEVEEFALASAARASDTPSSGVVHESHLRSRYRRPLFVSSGRGVGYRIVDIVTYAAVVGLILLIIWGGKAAWSGAGRVVDFTRAALPDVGASTAYHECSPVEPVVASAGDLAVLGFPRLFLYGEVADPVVSALRSAEPREVESMQALAFRITDGEAVAVRLAGHPADIGALYLNFGRKLEFCDALARAGFRVGGGSYEVGKDGRVQGSLPEKLEVLVSPRSGGVTAMRIRATN